MRNISFLFLPLITSSESTLLPGWGHHTSDQILVGRSSKTYWTCVLGDFCSWCNWAQMILCLVMWDYKGKSYAAKRSVAHPRGEQCARIFFRLLLRSWSMKESEVSSTFRSRPRQCGTDTNYTLLPGTRHSDEMEEGMIKLGPLLWVKVNALKDYHHHLLMYSGGAQKDKVKSLIYPAAVMSLVAGYLSVLLLDGCAGIDLV